MKLYIFRHGETDWNIAKKLQGRTDIPLNERGVELAKITSDAIKDLNFDYIFSSPLCRAVKTAEILRADRNVEIKTDERLVEMSFGEYEGLEPSKRPIEFLNFFNDPERYEAPNGAESYESALSRTKDFLDEMVFPIYRKKPDANILISGHGAMNRALITNLKNAPIKDFWNGTFQKNCCMNLFDITDKVILVLEEGKIFYDERNEDADLRSAR